MIEVVRIIVLDCFTSGNLTYFLVKQSNVYQLMIIIMCDTGQLIAIFHQRQTDLMYKKRKGLKVQQAYLKQSKSAKKKTRLS